MPKSSASSTKQATQPLCADSYPTLNKALQAYDYLFDELEGFLGRRSDEHGLANAAIIGRGSPANKCALTNAIQAAHAKLSKYCSGTWARMYVISVVLDPRIKMDYFRASDRKPRLVNHAKRAME